MDWKWKDAIAAYALGLLFFIGANMYKLWWFWILVLLILLSTGIPL